MVEGRLGVRVATDTLMMGFCESKLAELGGF